jgi:hypothetical protein
LGRAGVDVGDCLAKFLKAEVAAPRLLAMAGEAKGGVVGYATRSMAKDMMALTSDTMRLSLPDDHLAFGRRSMQSTTLLLSFALALATSCLASTTRFAESAAGQHEVSKIEHNTA